MQVYRREVKAKWTQEGRSLVWGRISVLWTVAVRKFRHRESRYGDFA
jgi:hypothetical protein